MDMAITSDKPSKHYPSVPGGTADLTSPPFHTHTHTHTHTQ